MYMLRSYGYKVVPLEPQISDYRGMPDYATGRRLAFIAAKRTDLSKLRAAKIDPFFHGSSRIGRATQGLRSVAFGFRNLTRPGVNHRTTVVRDLFTTGVERVRGLAVTRRR
jgi:hypothetical protein